MDKRYARLTMLMAIGVFLLFACLTAADASGRAQKRLPKHEYGTVVLNQFSEANQMAPVVFRHWVHRAKHTCRLCHIDIGFTMEAEATGIREADNRQGLFCGVCHNGKEAFGWETVKNGKTEKNCNRCHSDYPVGMDTKIRDEFMELAAKLPRGRFGDGIDWQKAEEEGLIKPKDFIAGVSFDRPKMQNTQGEINMNAKLEGLQDIIFSHKKHATWNGCELCHPDLFALQAGKTKFTMQDNFDSRFCGVCHGSVSFPLRDCGLCHVKPANQ